MGSKLSLHSVTSTIKSVTHTITKTVSKATGGGSSSKSSSSNKSSSSSSKSSSKSTNSNKSGSSRNKSTTKYVTNAPALYNSSGKKTTGTTKSPTLKPVAIKAPVTHKKKDSSVKEYSNNRPAQSYTHVKDYTLTASREGAGRLFYHSGTMAKGVKGVASGVTGRIP